MASVPTLSDDELSSESDSDGEPDMPAGKPINLLFRESTLQD